LCDLAPGPTRRSSDLLTSPVLAGRGRSGALLVMTVVSLALNIALNAWFIPRLGITGAALATTISVAVISVASLVMQVVETRSWLDRKSTRLNSSHVKI